MDQGKTETFSLLMLIEIIFFLAFFFPIVQNFHKVRKSMFIIKKEEKVKTFKLVSIGLVSMTGLMVFAIITVIFTINEGLNVMTIKV